ncbi:MAG TPA: BatD family protein, partial [Chthoniobacterales bacterium]|nr:BatD family protein [Chthoniobacterales bacterium]
MALAPAAALAQQPSVTAVLDSSETNLGNPVQLQIVVSGASNPKPPGEIKVDGLDIRSAGVSRQYQMQNFSVSYSFTYNYTIMPMQTGTFTIPPQTVDVGGRALKTPALSLNVVDSPGRSSRRGRDDTGSVDPAKIGFVEMLLPKQVAYVGEMIPVQIRLGLNMRAPVDSLGSGMQIAGQGFTTQKMPEPRQTIETINGRSYQVFIFKTAVSPVRAGKLEIGPAEIKPVVRVSRGGQRNPSLPRDLFDDPFFNNFFNDPAFAPSVPKEINLKSDATTIEVKPLPPNAPPTFSGAVGNFTMKSDANPKKVQVGDPITVTTAITGRGNFDRVTAPALENEAGWHKYPPSDKFTQDDDVGISGTKTFETVISPKERKDKMPPLVFTFFDPV